MDFSKAKQLLDPEQNIAVGEIVKTHGYKGHVNISFDFDALLLEEESVLVDINGWLVPFFVDYQESNLQAVKPIVKFFRVDTLEKAKTLVHSEILLPRSVAQKYVDLDSVEYLIGYKILDLTSGEQGTIIGFEEMKNNPLIIVDCCDGEILVPELAIEFVELDHQSQVLKIKAPAGIFGRSS